MGLERPINKKVPKLKFRLGTKFKQACKGIKGPISTRQWKTNTANKWMHQRKEELGDGGGKLISVKTNESSIVKLC